MTTGKMLKLFYWFMGGLVALLVVASVAVSFVDWNQYRSMLSTLASSQTGMRVELGGRVGVSLVPRPAVSAETVRLFPEGGSVSDMVATADRIEMRLGLGALLKGDLAIQHLGFDGLEVTLEEKPDGAWTVRGWPETDADAHADGGQTIQMDRLNIVGGTVHFINQVGVTRSVEGLTFDLEGSLPEGPLEWDGSFTAAGHKVRTEGRMRPSLREGVLSLKTDIFMPGGELRVSGSIEDEGFAGRVQTKGTNLQTFASAIKGVLDNADTHTPLPAKPFDLDVQIDREAGIYSVVTRTLKIGDTHGRVDLTVAERNGGFHAAGTTSLGIVGLEDWLAEEPERAASDIPATLDEAEGRETNKAILTGSIDVAIEGVRVGGGLVQQVDAVVKFAPDGAHLNNLQALLPGGSDLFFVGDINSIGVGNGTLRMASGNLQELLRWAQVDVAGRIPAGRLATAELETKVSLAGGYWQLSDLVGRVDTTNVTGHLEGKLGAVWPTRVQLVADSINFDAYLPRKTRKTKRTGQAGETNSLFADKPEEGATYHLTVNDILLGGAKYRNSLFVANMRDGALHIPELHTAQGNGSATFSGVIRPFDEQLEVNGEARLKNWSWSVVRYLLPDLKRHIRALGFQQVNGDLSVAGKAENLHVTATLAAPKGRKMSASGNISLKDKTLAAYEVQGAFEHDNLRSFLKAMEVQASGAIPANLTYSASRTEGGNDRFRVSGDLAGGQLIAEGQRTNDTQEWDITYDHRKAQDIVALANVNVALPSAGQALRGTGTVVVGNSGWQVKAMDVRNGSARVQGNLALREGRVNGKLALEGLSYTPQFADAASRPAQNNPVAIDPALFDMAGQVDISLDAVQLAGQMVSAPSAQLLMGDGVVRFDLGQGGKVNGTPSTLRLDLIQGGTPSAKGAVVLPNLDVGRMLSVGGLSAVVSGNAALDFQFEGTGHTLDDLLRSLRGQGTLDGAAGTLNFLSVPNLVRDMTRSPSVGSFLGTVGTWLRQGSTSYTALNTKFTLDAGTALVERITANGSWGEMVLDGQINFLDQFLNLKGYLDLATPPDAPDIPVQYEGALNNPTAAWASRALERFVISGIERRLRASLHRDLGQIQSEDAPENAGAAVFNRALGLLGALRERQAKQKAAEEAARKGQGADAQGTEEQTP